MSYTTKLDPLGHDLMIHNGKFRLVSGEDEIRQRIKVFLQHYQGEYFLNRNGGMPYYKRGNKSLYILGNKLSEQTIYNIMRQRIMTVPGVVSVDSADITKIGRDIKYQCRVTVRTESGNRQIDVDNIYIGE